jgi:prepilin peptidase CpaA
LCRARSRARAMAHSLASIAPALLVAGIGLLIVAALHDLAARTIPDELTAAIATIGILLRLHHGDFIGAIIAAGVMFGVTLLLWQRGWMGGGDVKLLTAIALLLAPAQLPGAIVAIGIAGALLALPYLALRGLIRRPAVTAHRHLLLRAWRAERFRLRKGGPLPYGVAIALGTLAGLAGAGA